MDVQNTDYGPKLNPWFSANVEYIGVGVAQFSKPAGTLQGKTYVRYDEFGNSEIKMTVEKITWGEKETSNVAFLLPFFFAGKEPDSEGIIFIPQVLNNLCFSLTVTTPEGQFIAESEMHYHLVGNILAQEPEVTFEPLQGHFESDSSATAQYFVAPLTNFVNNCGWLNAYYDAIAHHPLRMMVVPIPPNDFESLSREEQQKIHWQLLSGQNVVAFEFLDEVAFIEPLTDYEEREKKLKDGGNKCLTTAIMVGNIGHEEFTILNWQSLRLNDLLSVLSLANGNSVGCLWIETRDHEGKLIRRIHTSLSHRAFKIGLNALGQGGRKGGLGDLLTVAPKSQEFGKLYLRAAISQTVMGGQLNFEGNIEDRMSHLYRALDRLCAEHSSRKRISPLSSKRLKLLKDMTNAFTKTLNEIADILLIPAAHDDIQAEAEELKRLANAVNDAVWNFTSFPKSIELLLEKFGLHDTAILDKYYELNPSSAKAKTWSRVIADYRNRIMHDAWFDWQSKNVDMKELIAITFHLHDVLVRLLLVLLNYDGEYEPSILRRRELSAEILWVDKSKTSAKDLGYE